MMQLSLVVTCPEKLAVAIASFSVVGNGVNPMVELNELAESSLLEIVGLLKILIEAIALLILTLGIFKAVKELTFSKSNIKSRLDRETKLNQIRLDLGVVLALALEFLLAADIVATAVSPSWDALGKLAAISAIRTFLNFFLEKEVKELANKKLIKSERQNFGNS